MVLVKRIASLAMAALVAGIPVLGDAPRDDAKTASAVDEVFVDLTKPGSPGCSVAVARDGKTIFAKGYGLANIEENVTITPDTVFDIGSTSKQFSAASILLLEKQGKLSVNDDVHKYVPELPDYGKKVTILNLLNHTSGLRDYLVLFELSGVNVDSVTTDEDALALVTKQKALNFDPGSDWLYSNTGFFLLSTIVKRVSGKTLREFAAENIFTPLDMTHTLYRDDHTLLIPGRAMAYDPKEKGDGYTFNVSYFEQTGDGAVHTTTGDLLKWDENFYSGKVGGKDFLAEIQQTGKLNSGKPLEYAKGLFVSDYRGLKTVRHGGAWGGYRAELLRFPEQHLSIVTLCNRSDANPEKRANRVADVFLGAQMKAPTSAKKEDDDEDGPGKKRETAPMTTEQLAAFAGNYWSDELQVAYKLAIENGSLVLHIRNWPGKPLRPVSQDDLEASSWYGITLRGQRGADGKISGFTLDAGRTKGVAFVKQP